MSMHFAWDAAPQITTHLPPDVFSAEFVSECFWCQGMILFEFQTPFPCLNRFVSMYFRSSTEYCNTMQYYTMHVSTYLTCAFEIHQRGMKRFCSEMFEQLMGFLPLLQAVSMASYPWMRSHAFRKKKVTRWSKGSARAGATRMEQKCLAPDLVLKS